MTPVPLELPLKPAETAALAELIFSQAEGRRLTDAVRNRIAARSSQLKLSSFTPHHGSLSADPVHPSTYYLAADGASGEPLLLHLAPAAAPSSALFPNPLLIGRMRASGGREVVVNAIRFGPEDRERLRTFAGKIDPAFLPRPQASRTAVTAANCHPAISLPAAFDAFRSIYRKTGVNLASAAGLPEGAAATEEQIAARDGEDPLAQGWTRVSFAQLYHYGLWAAIRAGWREGYSAEAGILVAGATPDEIARSVEQAQEAIREAARYTRFSIDTSSLFHLEADPRRPGAWSDAEVNQRFEQWFTAEERAWMLDEFSRQFATPDKTYRLDAPQIARLAVTFGRGLKMAEDLYDSIRKRQHAFDFQPSAARAESLTRPEDLIFCLHWLKARGRPAQMAAPNLGFPKGQPYPETMDALEAWARQRGWPDLEQAACAHAGKPLDELAARLAALAAVARHFQATLAVREGFPRQAALLEAIGAAAAGRLQFQISGELQLQLFDVLREQPPASPFRKLFERMCARAFEFADRGAFGALEEAARIDRRLELGDPARGREGANPFLLSRLGYLVGSRDVQSPGGDRRFFQEKLDELPGELAGEARRRNQQYIEWLAGNLLR
jgi:hypothetical protein